MDMEIDENLNVDVEEREGKSKQKRGRKPVKRLDVNGSKRYIEMWPDEQDPRFFDAEILNNSKVFYIE
jgi:hypothetical protein